MASDLVGHHFTPGWKDPDRPETLLYVQRFGPHQPVRCGGETVHCVQGQAIEVRIVRIQIERPPEPYWFEDRWHPGCVEKARGE